MTVAIQTHFLERRRDEGVRRVVTTARVNDEMIATDHVTQVIIIEMIIAHAAMTKHISY